MPTGDDDLTPAATPTMIDARQVADAGNGRFVVEVEWDDHEHRDDELVTVFKFSPPGGSGAVYVDESSAGTGIGYSAPGTGRCVGTVLMSAGEFTVTARCSRYVTLSETTPGSGPTKVSIPSEWSNGVPCTVGKKNNGQGHGQGGNPNKPGKG